MKLVLATRNQGKIREIGEMLKDQNGIELLSLRNYPDAPEVVEDGKTYEENAIKKAAALAEYTGHLTIADDSGLEVDALDGATRPPFRTLCRRERFRPRSYHQIT